MGALPVGSPRDRSTKSAYHAAALQRGQGIYRRDIISLFQIANHVRKALYDTTGASTECRDLLAELDSVVHVVANVQRVLSVEGPSRIPQSIENGLYHAVGVCLNLLAQINDRILTWRKSLRDSQSARAVAADIWCRVGWMLFKKEELATLRRSLSGQVAAMNTLLTLAQGNQLDRFREESRESRTLIREIHHCVTRIPKRSGYSWEGDLDRNNTPITLDDMLGSTIILPWELCTTRKLFHEFLVFYFRDKPGRAFIENEEYYLTVTWVQWVEESHWVVAGSRIDMRAIIKAQAYGFPTKQAWRPLPPGMKKDPIVYPREPTLAELSESLIEVLGPLVPALIRRKMTLRFVVIQKGHTKLPGFWVRMKSCLGASVGPFLEHWHIHTDPSLPSSGGRHEKRLGYDVVHKPCSLALSPVPFCRDDRGFDLSPQFAAHIRVDTCYLDDFVPAHPHGQWAYMTGPRILAQFTLVRGRAPKAKQDKSSFPRWIESRRPYSRASQLRSRLWHELL